VAAIALTRLAAAFPGPVAGCGSHDLARPWCCRPTTHRAAVRRRSAPRCLGLRGGAFSPQRWSLRSSR
jgi:hypothetical protein